MVKRSGLAYFWAAPASLVGLLLAVPVLVNALLPSSLLPASLLPASLLPASIKLSRGQARWHSGVLEVAGGLPGWLLSRRLPFSGPVAAITLGHVVLACSPAALMATRRHERVHVAQYERWGGLFFIVYTLASLHAWLRGKHPYLDNVFEVEARGKEGTRGKRKCAT